jgi:hypothetical protein
MGQRAQAVVRASFDLATMVQGFERQFQALVEGLSAQPAVVARA